MVTMAAAMWTGYHLEEVVPLETTAPEEDLILTIPTNQEVEFLSPRAVLEVRAIIMVVSAVVVVGLIIPAALVVVVILVVVVVVIYKVCRMGFILLLIIWVAVVVVHLV